MLTGNALAGVAGEHAHTVRHIVDADGRGGGNARARVKKCSWTLYVVQMNRYNVTWKSKAFN